VLPASLGGGIRASNGGGLSALFSPAQNPRLARRLGSSARTAAFYRLVMEAMIGMALGRAVSPERAEVAHEEAVVRLLTSLAADL